MYDISVIVPIYNGEKFIKKCLDSLCNQSLKNIEIICINDGSTDNTMNILESYSFKDNRIKIISTLNYGQGHARNIGLSQANGEYIAFVDADDWIDKYCLEKAYSKSKSDDLDMLFFQMINYIESSNEFIETDLYNYSCFYKNGIDNKTIFNHNDAHEFLFEIPVCPVSKLYKRNFLFENNLKFPEGFIFEDNPFFYNAFFKCNKAGFLNEHFYYRRRHGLSVTQMFDKKKYDIVKATNKLLDTFIIKDFYEQYKIDVINHTFSMILEWFEKSPLGLKHKFYEIIRKEFYGFNNLKEDFETNLNEMYLPIYNLFNNNDYYLDFLTEYKLQKTNYVVFDGYKESDLCNNQLEGNYKISVIIPIYNNEKYIHRTLMSIENQSIGIENIEVLMVNDASTDNTSEIINEYAKKYSNFKAIHIENGTGSPGTPRNIGLNEAASDYVIFLDHDDLFEINALEILYDSIVTNGCDLVYGTYVSIDYDKPTKIIFPNEKHGYFEDINENERAIAFPPPSIWTKLFKKDFLLENNILFPTILGEDAIFISKALINAKNGFYYLWDSIICYHCLDGASYTNNISYRYLSEGLASETYMYEFYKSEGHENYYKIRGEGIFDFYLNQFRKSQLNKNEINKLWDELYCFVDRLNSMGLSPHDENNKNLVDYIIRNDMETILKIKAINSNVSKKSKIKSKIINLIKKIKLTIISREA